MANVVQFPMTKESALRLLATVEPERDGHTTGFAVTPAQKAALEFLFENEAQEEFFNTL